MTWISRDRRTLRRLEQGLATEAPDLVASFQRWEDPRHPCSDDPNPGLPSPRTSGALLALLWWPTSLMGAVLTMVVLSAPVCVLAAHLASAGVASTALLVMPGFVAAAVPVYRYVSTFESDESPGPRRPGG